MGNLLSNVKVTVIRRFNPEEVFKVPPVKAKYSGPCPVFEEGQEFIVDDTMPNGFCPYAWAVLRDGIMTLGANGNFSDWYEEPGVAVSCCPDGLRPVIFKIERV